MYEVGRDETSEDRDGGAVAVLALWDPGFTTGSCYTGTAPTGRTGRRRAGVTARHAAASPWCLSSPPLPSHGRRQGTERLCTWAGAQPCCPPPRLSLLINPPGRSSRPAAPRRAGPARRRRPRLAAWSWRCPRQGWRRWRGAGSCRRDLRSAGENGSVGAPGAPPAPRAHSLWGPGEQHGMGGTLPSAPLPAPGGDPPQRPITSTWRGPSPAPHYSTPGQPIPAQCSGSPHAPHPGPIPAACYRPAR